MNRRGYIFTILAIVVVAVVIAGIGYKTAKSGSSTLTEREQVLSANHYLVQLDNDLSRVLFVTGYRGLLGLEEHVSNTGQYLSDLPVQYASVMQNGTINGTFYDVMQNATFDDFVARERQMASAVGMNVQLRIRNVSLQQVAPFVVEIQCIFTVNASMQDNTTRWDYEENVSRNFSIEQLKDPLYAVGTLGRVPVLIISSNVTHPYITADNDTTKLQIIFNNTLFVPDTQAPSFVMRFTGNLSPSPYGIASLVDTKELDRQDIPVHTDRSVVDYLYFGNSSTTTNMIVNMPDRFLLDNNHLASYDAVGKTR